MDGPLRVRTKPALRPYERQAGRFVALKLPLQPRSRYLGVRAAIRFTVGARIVPDSLPRMHRRDLLDRLENEGPQTFTSLMHHCPKPLYDNLGRILSDFGITTTGGGVTAGGLYSGGFFALATTSPPPS